MKKENKSASLLCVALLRVLYSGDGEQRLHLSISDNMKSARWLQDSVQTYTLALPDKSEPIK